MMEKFLVRSSGMLESFSAVGGSSDLFELERSRDAVTAANDDVSNARARERADPVTHSINARRMMRSGSKSSGRRRESGHGEAACGHAVPSLEEAAARRCEIVVRMIY